MKKSWKRPIYVFAAAGCAAFLAVGCSGGSTPQQAAMKPQPAAETGAEAGQAKPAAAAAERQGAFVYPLTGLPSEAKVKNRPVMVMVENSPQARPQSGLDQADIVYEILAEGEITRFLAVFQSRSPKVIGPVRSIRPYFVEIGDGLDALIVHAGWSQDAINIIASRRLAHFDEVYGDGAYFWRSGERKQPHNLYTSIEKIREGAVNKKFREEWNGPLVTFSKTGQGVDGQAAGNIQIPYLNGYRVAYEYDAGTGLYKRLMDGKPHTDKESGKQLSAKNVLILESKHEVLDDAGRRSVDVFGPGKGYIAQQGKAASITWERKQNLIRAFKDGKEVPLLPGQTWIQVVPEGTKVTLQ
jgi:hypothetical protein